MAHKHSTPATARGVNTAEADSCCQQEHCWQVDAACQRPFLTGLHLKAALLKKQPALVIKAPTPSDTLCRLHGYGLYVIVAGLLAGSPKGATHRIVDWIDLLKLELGISHQSPGHPPLLSTNNAAGNRQWLGVTETLGYRSTHPLLSTYSKPLTPNTTHHNPEVLDVWQCHLPGDSAVLTTHPGSRGQSPGHPLSQTTHYSPRSRSSGCTRGACSGT
jgi:hypothetical protein